MSDLTGMLCSALSGDALAASAVADALKEAGKDEAAKDWSRLMALRPWLFERLCEAEDELEALREEWGEFGPDSFSDVGQEAAAEAQLHAYRQVIHFLESA